MPGVSSSPISLNEVFSPVYRDSHRSSHSFTSVAPSSLAHRDLRRPCRALLGFKLNTFPFPGALTFITSFDHHHHPCKCRGSWQLGPGGQASHKRVHCMRQNSHGLGAAHASGRGQSRQGCSADGHSLSKHLWLHGAKCALG